MGFFAQSRGRIGSCRAVSSYFLTVIVQVMSTAPENGVDLFVSADEDQDEKEPDLCLPLSPVTKRRRTKKN